MRNHYAVLGIPPDADRRRIQRAYRALARRVHPDVNRSPNAALEFRAATEAYEVLRDPERRQAYDRELRAARVRDRLRRDAKRRPGPSHPWSSAPREANRRHPSSGEPQGGRPDASRSESRPRTGRGRDPWDLPGRPRKMGPLRGERAVHFGCGALVGGLLGLSFGMRELLSGDPLELLPFALGGALLVGVLAAMFRHRLWPWTWFLWW